MQVVDLKLLLESACSDLLHAGISFGMKRYVFSAFLAFKE